MKLFDKDRKIISNTTKSQNENGITKFFLGPKKHNSALLIAYGLCNSWVKSVSMTSTFAAKLLWLTNVDTHTGKSKNINRYMSSMKEAARTNHTLTLKQSPKLKL